MRKTSSAADPLQGMTKDEQRAWSNTVLAMGHRNREDGSRLVIRRHPWGFSETILKREGEYWKTVKHTEYRLEDV